MNKSEKGQKKMKVTASITPSMLKTTENKRKEIEEKRKELIEKYGDNPIIQSSEEFTTEKNFPIGIKINIDKKVLDECYPSNNNEN